MKSHQYFSFFYITFVAIIFFANIPNFSSSPWPEVVYGQNEKPDKAKKKISINRQINVHNPDAIFFVGDILLARNVETLMKKHGNDYPFLKFSFDDFSENYFAIGNFESSIPAKHIHTPNNNTVFSTPTTSLNLLKTAGFSHLSLANNHSNDFGGQGLSNTKKTLNEFGFYQFGDPKNLKEGEISIISIGDYSFSLIGINTVFQNYTDDELENLLGRANSVSDYQFIFIHWGEEYNTSSNRPQRDFATKLIGYGADLIVGHHPHVVQEVSEINGVPVFYSLGNFIFDQYFSQETQEGLVLRLSTEEDPVIHLLPVSSISNISQPRLMSEPEALIFFKKLTAKSKKTLQDQIMSGKIYLHQKVATSSKIAMITK